VVSWSLSEGERLPGDGMEAQTSARGYFSRTGTTREQPSSPSESAPYACPDPLCTRPRWSATPGYCFSCGQPLIPVKGKK
jgi:hypothetical protein